MDEQNERDDAELKVYLFRAKIILSVFAALFFVSAILSVFSVTAFAGFIMCCVFSLMWTIVYNLFAQEKLSKYDKKYIRWYIFIVVETRKGHKISVFRYLSWASSISL